MAPPFQARSGGILVDTVVEPPYPFAYLRELGRASAHLRPNIDAMAVNIDGHGHDFVRILDPDAPGAREAVAAILDYERWLAAGGIGDEAGPDLVLPESDDVTRALERLRVRQRRERVLLDYWFATATLPPMTFTTLRKETQQDRQWYGNAYWEVIRGPRAGADRLGRILWVQRVPGSEVKIVRGRGGKVAASYVVRRTALTSEVVKFERSFRRYVQICGGTKVYFKAFGDPREMSRETGRYVSETNGVLPEGEHAATELIHFRVPDPASEYGIPGWMHAYLSVLGSRRSDEVNADFFANNAIPPLAVLVESGRLSAKSAAKIRTLFQERKARGTQAFWEILVLEAMGSDDFGVESSGKANIKLESLMKDLDGTDRYAAYDQANSDKVAGTFRLGRVLRGMGDKVNRATAMALLMIAESQVFAPERADFDAFMTNSILPEIGVTSWRFVSNGPKMADPAEIVAAAQEAFESRAITRIEYRDVLRSLGFPLAYETGAEEEEESEQEDEGPETDDPIPGEDEPDEEQEQQE